MSTDADEPTHADAWVLADPANVVDAMGLLPLHPDPASARPVTPESGKRILRLAGLTVVAAVPFFTLLLLFPGPTALGLLAVVIGSSVYGHWRRGVGPLKRAIRDHDPAVELRRVERPLEGYAPLVGVHLPLTPGAERRPFDPADPDDLTLAHTLRRCRILDGLVFEHGLRIEQAPLGRHPQRPLETRVREWLEIRRWLDGKRDPQAAWLGAIALTEDRMWRRAEQALSILGERPWSDALHGAMLAGRLPAVIAALTHRADVDGLDGLIERVAARDLDLQLGWLQARLRFDDPPLARLVDDTRWGAALVATRPEGLDDGQWLALVRHPEIVVAATAALAAPDAPADRARTMARALLDRDDIAAAADESPRTAVAFARTLARTLAERTDLALPWSAHQSPITQAAAAMLARLGATGDVDDLRRVGRWLQIGPLRREARRALDDLQGRAGPLPDGGALALASTHGGELSTAP